MKTPDTNSDSKDAKRPRIHKRTILCVLLVVVLPWSLVSVPGDAIGGAGTTGLSVNYCQHGWPFIHMHSVHYDLYGSWINGTFVQGKPADTSVKSNAIASFNDFFHSAKRDSRFFEWDLRLTKSQWGEAGHWSDTSNWTVWDDEHHFEIRWPGLLANVLLLSVFAVMIGWSIERNIRSGKFLKFSLLSFGVFVTLSCLCLTYGISIYTDFRAEHSFLQKLQQLEQEGLVGLNLEYVDRFPRVISQLFNGGYPLGDNQQMFRKVSDATVDVYIVRLDDEDMERLLQVLDQGDFGIAIHSDLYNSTIENRLKKLDKYRIVSLELYYDVYDWFSDQTGEDFYDLSREEFLRKSAIAVKLDLALPHIEDLSVELESYLTAEEQLKPFLDLPAQANVFIEGVDEEAGKFILGTQDRWPESFDFGPAGDGVSPELLKRLRHRFPAPAAEEGGIF